MAALTVTEFICLLEAYKKAETPAEHSIIKNEIVKSFKNESQLVELKDLEKILGASRTTVYRMRKSGIIPEYLVKGKPKFDPNEVKNAIRISGFNFSSSC